MTAAAGTGSGGPPLDQPGAAEPASSQATSSANHAAPASEQTAASLQVLPSPGEVSSGKRQSGPRIVDTHQHLGSCRVFDASLGKRELLEGLAANGVDQALVMPFPGSENVSATHDAIAALGTMVLGTMVPATMVRGIACPNPHADAYEDEVERCVGDLGFVALKLHTVGHAVDPLTADGLRAFATADRLGVPIIVHTGGVGEPFASPSHCLPLARRFPDLQIVLAHAGMGVATVEAGIVAGECDNVWLETSWCSVLDVARLLEMCGPDKLMFGSDAVENIPVELTRWRSLGLSGDELAACLGGNAIALYGL